MACLAFYAGTDIDAVVVFQAWSLLWEGAEYVALVTNVRGSNSVAGAT